MSTPKEGGPAFQTDLVVRGAELPAAQQISVESVAERIMTGELTPEKLAMMKDLLAMSREAQFAAALAELEAELPVIVASTPIPNRGKYERFEDMMQKIQPLLSRHRFSVRFSQTNAGGVVTETCHLRHASGHEVSNSYSVRSGRRADNEAQADLMASTTAKRKALQHALNIVVRQDALEEEHDARFEGGPITQAQAEELSRRVSETNSDRAAFLRFAGAPDFFSIPSAKYAILDASLKKKERR